MSTHDYYEAQFRWPHPDANSVIVTGEFDAWTASHRLSRTANGFEGTVQVPWGRKLAYKYIVDGRWTTTDNQPTELDSIGNLNNVYYAPARPSTPKSQLPAPEATEKFEGPPATPPSAINGILTTAKNAAVAMVEALAPGTTETPLPTPAITADPVKEHVLQEAAEVREKVAKPTADTVGGVTASVQAKVEEAVAPAPEPKSALADAPVPTPKEEVNAEAVLPTSVEEASAAPVIPVPILPLTSTVDVSGTNNQPTKKTLDTNVVEGSATNEAQAEPSTHTPAAPVSETVNAPNGAPAAPSTHTPAVNGSDVVAPSESAPPTHVTTKSDLAPPAVNGVNGKHMDSKPAEIPLPLPTPSEVPVPVSLGLNDKPAESATSSPSSSPRKEKRSAFPTFGRHHRQSSSTSVSTTPGTPDEHGILESPSRRGTQKKKRTSSIFGKLKHIFTDDHKKEKEHAKEISS